MDSNLWYNLLLSILTLLVSTATAFLAKWLKAKFSAQTLTTAKTIATTVVEAMEQIGATLGWNGPTKYAQAITYFAALAEKAGISLSADQVKALIESAVLILNDAWLDLDQEEASPSPTA